MKTQWLTQKHFQFTNFLIQDELVACQIVVDVANHFLNKSVSVLKNIHFRDNQIEVYKVILDLISKRLKFSRYSFSNEEIFHNAIFFLIGDLEFEVSECAYITQYPSHEIMKIYNYAKFQFLEKKSFQKEISNESWN